MEIEGDVFFVSSVQRLGQCIGVPSNVEIGFSSLGQEVVVGW